MFLDYVSSFLFPLFNVFYIFITLFILYIALVIFFSQGS